MEDGLKSKNARKQTSFKIQFYIGIHVTSFDFQQFYLFEPISPSPSGDPLEASVLCRSEMDLPAEPHCGIFQVRLPLKPRFWNFA